MSNYFPSEVKDLHESKQRVIGNVLHEIDRKQRKPKVKWQYVAITAALLFSMLFFLRNATELSPLQESSIFMKPTIMEEKGVLYLNSVTLGDSKEKVITIFGEDYQTSKEDEKLVIEYEGRARFYFQEHKLELLTFLNVDPNYFDTLFDQYEGFTFFFNSLDDRFIYTNDANQLINASWQKEQLTLSFSSQDKWMLEKAEYFYTVDQNLKRGALHSDGETVDISQPQLAEENGSLSLQGIRLGDAPSSIMEQFGDEYLIGYIDGLGSDFTLDYGGKVSFSFFEDQLVSAIYTNIDKEYVDQLFDGYNGFKFSANNDDFIYSKETGDAIKATTQTPNEEMYLYFMKAGPEMFENPEISSNELEMIADTVTNPEVEFIEPLDNYLLLEWHIDNMDRGNHDYETHAHPRLVVDPNDKEVKRGDVLYFKSPDFNFESSSDFHLPEFSISRVVGLEGETVEIKNGQVFIDGKKLDTFYSKALNRGMEQEEYFEKVDPVNRNNDEYWEEYFATTMKPVLVEENTVFILGDNWWRSIDSKDFGVLPLENVEGKVLGYEK